LEGAVLAPNPPELTPLVSSVDPLAAWSPLVAPPLPEAAVAPALAPATVPLLPAEALLPDVLPPPLTPESSSGKEAPASISPVLAPES
jgi:hypothetical protein